MKNINKLFSGLILMLGCLFMVSLSHAVGASISPKQDYELSYTTTISTATPIVSSNTAANAQYMPGAVYGVYQSSGAASEYFQMYDSSTTTNITTCGQTSGLGGNATLLGGRWLFGSTTAGTYTKIDPPISFYNGLVVCDSAGTGQTMVVYEQGRGLSGQ